MSVKWLKVVSIFFVVIFINSCDWNETDIGEENQVNGNADLFRSINPYSDAGLVQAIIEIPAGTNQKWEVDKTSGKLIWEKKDGENRIINYISYPWNYGMVPGTWLPEEEGGDNDPLDIIILGPAQDRGSIAQVRLIGVIQMVDGGEQDDKLLAVLPGGSGPFNQINDIEDLSDEYPGVIDIIKLWLENYKGEGIVTVLDIGDADLAKEILDISIQEFQKLDSKN